MKKKIITFSIALLALLASDSAKAVDPMNALSGIFSSLTSSSNFEISDIVGTWDYQSPAVSFKSDAALSKIGGMAASVALEDKLTPYYNAAGLNSLVLTVNSDDTFTMKIKSITLSGTISKDDEAGSLTFSFSAFGKVSIGKVSAMAQKSATNNLTLTFDASRVISIIEKVADIAKIQSLETLSSLLSNYEGVYAGARLVKTGSSSTSNSNNSTNSSPAETNQSSSGTSGLMDALKGLINK